MFKKLTNNDFIIEYDIYEFLRKQWEDQGDKIYGDVRVANNIIDLVRVTQEGIVHAVELKMKPDFKVYEQAIRNGAYSDYSWMCWPAYFSRRFSLTPQVLKDACEKSGIGLITMYESHPVLAIEAYSFVEIPARRFSWSYYKDTPGVKFTLKAIEQKRYSSQGGGNKSPDCISSFSNRSKQLVSDIKANWHDCTGRSLINAFYTEGLKMIDIGSLQNQFFPTREGFIWSKEQVEIENKKGHKSKRIMWFVRRQQ